MLQIDSGGLVLFGRRPLRMSTSEFRLSTSPNPAVVLIPPTNFLRLNFNTLLITLNHRIATSANIFTLREVDSIITEFNGDLNGFNSTLVLVVTWQVCKNDTNVALLRLHFLLK